MVIGFQPPFHFCKTGTGEERGRRLRRFGALTSVTYISAAALSLVAKSSQTELMVEPAWE